MPLQRNVVGCVLLNVLLLAGGAHGDEQSTASKQYLALIENLGGFAEQHWNEKEENYDAAGKGVTWARGNGGVCLVMAVLLEEYPDREEFFPQKVPREVILGHVKRTLRRL